MEHHNLRVVGYCDVPAPSAPTHAARLQDVQAAQSQAPIFITGVTAPAGNTGNFQYVPGTVPANKIVTAATSDRTTVRVHFMAESPATFYSPSVTFGGNPVTFIQEAADDRRVYIGYQDVTLTEDGVVTLISSSGASASVQINLAIGGPAVTAATLGSYPGTQTEVKVGDVVTISGTVANSAVSMAVVDFGAAGSGTINTFGANDSAGVGFKTFTGTITIANRTGTFASRITATNSLGTVGTPFDTTNTRILNQTVPTIAVPTFTYPAGQEAVKSGQTVTAVSAIANADVVSYSFAIGSVDADTVIATSKTLNCTSNQYNVSTNNYVITATRSANGATFTRQAVVAAAGVAATVSVSIVGNPARLRSSAAGNDYTVQVTSNQNVHTTQAPTLSAPAGSWVGSWSRSGNIWSRTLRITDATATGSYSFSGLSLMNKALVETTAINAGANYVVGGIVLRTITFPAFSRYQPIGAVVVTNAKVRAQYAGTGSDLTLRADTASAQNSFTLVDSAGNYAPTGGTHLFISDEAFANSNTSGTLQLTVEEIV
jgi:hypothetical protein